MMCWPSFDTRHQNAVVLVTPSTNGDVEWADLCVAGQTSSQTKQPCHPPTDVFLFGRFLPSQAAAFTPTKTDDDTSSEKSQERRVIFPSLHQNSSSISSQSDIDSSGIKRYLTDTSEGDRVPKQKSPGSLNSPHSPSTRRSIFPSTEVGLRNIHSVSEDPPLTPNLRSEPVCSILRKSTLGEGAKAKEVTDKEAGVDKIPSVPSIPSLAGSSQSSQESLTRPSLMFTPGREPLKPTPVFRSTSEPVTKADCRKLRFDPRVWVREFHRDSFEEEATWYSTKELEGFRKEVAAIIMAHAETQLVPTGTGRFVARKVMPQGKAFFSHRALRCDDLDDDEPIPSSKAIPSSVKKSDECMIKRILLVDPHPLCLKLFSKGFSSGLPGVSIATACTGDEAWKLCEKESFDLVVAEERLRPMPGKGPKEQQMENLRFLSGSSLLGNLARSSQKRALLIGVSMKPREDEGKFLAHGADMCWSKPPPPLTQTVLQQLSSKLRTKRGRSKS